MGGEAVAGVSVGLALVWLPVSCCIVYTLSLLHGLRQLSALREREGGLVKENREAVN